ncbi:hypothetical protein FACS1894164_12520 [Spirochaetia bacterium]|nr:hypothetical protein FACS1894164_12520 [Spirochaetia bacterium]
MARLVRYVKPRYTVSSHSTDYRESNLNGVDSVVSHITEERKKCRKCGESVDADIFECPKCRNESFL